MRGLVVLLLTAVASVSAKVYDRCDLAKELENQNIIPMKISGESSPGHKMTRNQVETWVCIAFRESSLDTTKINHRKNDDGSKDYGLFQLNNKFWCSDGSIESKNACNKKCSDFVDDDITDDLACAKMVLESQNGLDSWYTYKKGKEHGKCHKRCEDSDAGDCNLFGNLHQCGDGPVLGEHERPDKEDKQDKKAQPSSEISNMIYSINKHYKYTRLDKQQIDDAVCVAAPKGEYVEVEMSDEEVKSQLASFIKDVTIEMLTTTIKPETTTIRTQITTTEKPVQKWFNSGHEHYGRCGKRWTLDDGSQAECNPNSEDMCCSQIGFCGGGRDKRERWRDGQHNVNSPYCPNVEPRDGETSDYWSCPGCVDYSIAEKYRRKREVSSGQTNSPAVPKKTKRFARNFPKPKKVQKLPGYFDGCDELQYLDGCERDEIRFNKVCTTVLSTCEVNGDPYGRVLVNKTTREGYCQRRVCHPSRVFVDNMCYDPKDPAINHEGRITYITMFGTPVSSCPDGYYESPKDNNKCQPILTKIDSCPGKVFWFENFHHQPKCLDDPCGGLNLNRQDDQWPFVPSEEDGKCYELGTQPEICTKKSFFHYYFVNMDKLKGVCERLDDAGYLIFTQAEMNELKDRFGEPVPKPKQKFNISTPASTKQIKNLVMISPVVPVHSVIHPNVIPVNRHPKFLYVQPTYTIPWSSYGHHHRQKRNPNQQFPAALGNVFDSQLVPCPPGSANGYVGKCRMNIQAPDSHHSIHNRAAPATHPVKFNMIPG